MPSLADPSVDGSALSGYQGRVESCLSDNLLHSLLYPPQAATNFHQVPSSDAYSCDGDPGDLPPRNAGDAMGVGSETDTLARSPTGNNLEPANEYDAPSTNGEPRVWGTSNRSNPKSLLTLALLLLPTACALPSVGARDSQVCVPSQLTIPSSNSTIALPTCIALPAPPSVLTLGKRRGGGGSSGGSGGGGSGGSGGSGGGSSGGSGGGSGGGGGSSGAGSGGGSGGAGHGGSGGGSGNGGGRGGSGKPGGAGGGGGSSNGAGSESVKNALLAAGAVSALLIPSWME